MRELAHGSSWANAATSSSMAKRHTRSRASTRLPKTLTGVMGSCGLTRVRGGCAHGSRFYRTGSRHTRAGGSRTDRHASSGLDLRRQDHLRPDEQLRRCPDGSLINKAGTSLLALAARDQGVPFYVCSERFKQRPPAWGDPEFEQMDPGELGAPVWAGVTVANEYFDRTPAGLISAWFDEQGQGR